MKKISYIISILLIILLSVCLTGCKSLLQETERFGKQNQNTVEDTMEEMLVAVNVDSSSTELPFENVWLNRSRFWGGLIFQGLLIADSDIGNVSPDLCEEYIISTDGMKYTFVLKENLYWHDGKPLTAEDVVWSIETCLKVQETNGYIKRGLQKIWGVEEFEQGKAESICGIEVEQNDITITLSGEDGNFLAAIAQLAILPKHCLEKVSVEEFSKSEFWKKPIGSGPYKVVENIDNTEAVLEVNNSFSGKIPKIKRIRYKVLEYPGPDHFDFTITSDPETINRYKKDENYAVVPSNNLYYRYLIFNLDERSGLNEDLLQSAEVRRALVLGLDRESILADVYHGSAVAINGGIPKDDSWYIKKADDEVGYRPALAKQILKNAGFDFTKTLVLTRYSKDELSVRLLEEIAASWRKLGISVEINPIESDSTNKLFVDADWYDVALKNLAAVDYTEWYFEYSSENQLWSKILNERREFDSLINSINHSFYANELKMLYSEIQKMENHLNYKIPIAIVPQYVIYNKKHVYIPEMEFPNLWFYFDLNIADWEIMEE